MLDAQVSRADASPMLLSLVTFIALHFSVQASWWRGSAISTTWCSHAYTRRRAGSRQPSSSCTAPTWSGTSAFVCLCVCVCVCVCVNVPMGVASTVFKQNKRARVAWCVVSVYESCGKVDGIPGICHNQPPNVVCYVLLLCVRAVGEFWINVPRCGHAVGQDYGAS